MNFDKFQFAQREINIAGFRVTETEVKPLDKYLRAISEFSTPKRTVDIRSWFGLVHQVSHYNKLTEMIKPFKPFLSPKMKFAWNEDLDHAFESSKEAIIRAIKDAVEIYDPGKLTCLRPDWSQRGIGYFLSQKHCTCNSSTPSCCENAWRIMLAGSRFLKPAETRYAAVEGEALAIAWSLEHTKFFPQSCDNLVVVSDHKPLVRLFGDRTLDQITNSRLFSLKQRTLPWRFTVVYISGKENLFSDATSILPHQDAVSGVTESEISAGVMICEPDEADDSLADLSNSDNENIRAITWELVKQETYDAHQGVSGMNERAKANVYWPGITKDIQSVRAKCHSCNNIMPSQSRISPAEPWTPTTPFEAIACDYFHFKGHYYFVAADRLSGWFEVQQIQVGTNEAGAEGLCKALIRSSH